MLQLTEQEQSEPIGGLKVSTPVDISLEVAKIRSIQAEMNTELIEADTLVNELLLAIISRGHLIAIGERGIAKTFAVDVFLEHLEGVRKFYVLCSKSMPPEMLFGHLSIKRLAEDDVLAHKITGKMPDSHVVVLDEGFKNNAVNLNGSLGIINERRFITNGGTHECPLWTVVLTSNMDEYQITGELAAFRDRFGAALHVEAVKTDDGFRRILEGQAARFAKGVSIPPAHTKMTHDEIVTLQNACRAVTHPSSVMEAMVELNKRATLEGLRPSARRYGQLMQRMSAQAILNGRWETKPEDLTLAQHSLWTDIEDIPKAYELIVQFAGQAVSVANALRKTLEPAQATLNELAKTVDPSIGRPPNDSLGTVAEVLDQLKEIKKHIDKAKAEAESSGEDTTELDAVARDLSVARKVVNSYLGMDE